MRAWRNRLPWTWCRRRARLRSRWNTITRNGHAVNNVNRVNAPAFTAASVIAPHAPAESCRSKTGRQDDNRGDKALRIATPRLTPCDRTAPISGDCSVITARGETAANGENVLKCISTVGAHLKHASIEPNIWIHVGSFEIEILPKRQLNRSDRKL